MATTNDTGTARTIEDIERRQQEVRAIEFDAVRTLITVLRELAIALPPESKLPYDLADAAKSLEEKAALYEGMGEIASRWGVQRAVAAEPCDPRRDGPLAARSRTDDPRDRQHHHRGPQDRSRAVHQGPRPDRPADQEAARTGSGLVAAQARAALREFLTDLGRTPQGPPTRSRSPTPLVRGFTTLSTRRTGHRQRWPTTGTRRTT